MGLEKVRVSADGTHVYEAMVDKSLDWNGFLMPRFSLETVKQIAADLAQDIAEVGYEYQEDIRVIEAPGYTGYPEGVDEEDSDPVTAVVVIHISWMYYFDDGAERCTKVLTPGEDGLYAIGAGSWTWSEVTDPVDEIHWPTYVEEFAVAALHEALWWESNPDDEGVGGDEHEAIEHFTVEDIASPTSRKRWMQMCREYVELNKEHLAGIASDQAGNMFWQSKRDGRGFPDRDFKHDKSIPKKVRRVLHTTAGRWPVGYLFIRDEKIHFDL